MFAREYEGTYQVPEIVKELAAGRDATAVWRNDLGGLTFRLGNSDGDGDGDDQSEFLKWVPRGNGVDLSAEVERLTWAVQYTAVPRVLSQEADEQGSWFLSAALPGTSAVEERWTREPATAVRAIGAGLRSMHEALPVSDCPFSRSAQQRLALATASAAAGKLDPARWHEDHRHIGSVERALDMLADIPPVDELVVCHGDTCSPNTLIDDDGNCSGHVDLDTLGVADRWADLAVATWATTWNYGPGWEEPLLAAYGVDPDWERIRYYRLLWQLCD